MAKGFSIAKYAEALTPAAPAGERDIEAITAEYLQHKKNGGKAILGMGNCLIEIKSRLPRGEWLTWLEEKADCTERAAQRLMKLAREFSNPTALSDLGATKAMSLLVLPPDEREAFMAESHMVNGQEKTVVDMTSRELEKAIQERDEARKAAEAARADARSAEESRAKMETDILMLKELHQSALDEPEHAAEDSLAAQKELKKLRERPIDVAVEVDQEAVERARAEAVAEMEERVRLAETARIEAETALEEARRKLEGMGRQDEQKPSRRKKDSATIAHARSAAETALNQIHGVRLLSIDRDMAMSEEARRTLLNLADYARRCAE